MLIKDGFLNEYPSLIDGVCDLESYLTISTEFTHECYVEYNGEFINVDLFDYDVINDELVIQKIKLTDKLQVKYKEYNDLYTLYIYIYENEYKDIFEYFAPHKTLNKYILPLMVGNNVGREIPIETTYDMLPDEIKKENNKIIKEFNSKFDKHKIHSLYPILLYGTEFKTPISKLKKGLMQ